MSTICASVDQHERRGADNGNLDAGAPAQPEFCEREAKTFTIRIIASRPFSFAPLLTR
jgi:hypothetical protein